MTQLNEESVVTEPPAEWQCSGCQNAFTGEPPATLSRGPICEDCLAVCPDCNRQFNLQSGYMHADIGEGAICNVCTRNNYFTCAHCEEWTSDGRLEHDPYGRSICRYCYENEYGNCDDCDQFINLNNYHECERPYSDVIRSYSDKPEAIFHHLQDEFDSAPIITQESPNVIRKYRKIAYMGIECEVELPNHNAAYFRDGASLFRDSEVIYLKEDGSINYGFEIVSHPMTLGWAMERFDWSLFTKLQDLGFEAWEESTVGIHIHVSRDGFASDFHQVKFVHFITRNEGFLTWLVGRGSGQYSRFDRRHLRGMTKARLKGRDSSDRYMAVNLNNNATIEVRMFQSSLKPERIKMNLQLIDAIVKYTEELQTSEILHNDGFSPDSFINFIQRYLTRYPNLAEYVDKWHEALAFEQEHGYKARIGE